jgi:hypothetical protein
LPDAIVDGDRIGLGGVVAFELAVYDFFAGEYDKEDLLLCITVAVLSHFELDDTCEGYDVEHTALKLPIA